jgi:hypothetical protein
LVDAKEETKPADGTKISTIPDSPDWKDKTGWFTKEFVEGQNNNPAYYSHTYDGGITWSYARPLKGENGIAYTASVSPASWNASPQTSVATYGLRRNTPTGV